MKSHLWTSCVALLGVLLLVGCSNPPPSSTLDKSSSSAASTVSEPTVVPLPEAVPAPAQKEKPKPKPKPRPTREAAVPQPAPVNPEPEIAPPVAETAPITPVNKIKLVILPAGTLIPVRTIDSIDSRTDHVGQTFRASVDSDIAIEDEVVVPKGADATLKLVQVSSAGEIRGKSELQLQLERIVVGEGSYFVVSNVIERSGAAEGPKTAKDIGIGAAIGAAIGALAGGKKGAAIGAGVGAGSGAAVAAITKGEQVLVPSETRLEFRLEQPVKIAVTIRPAT